ncbi:MAG TPA: hypothetical protein VF522_14095 [Ramlibacter sp.]|uniref:hypothetical protein n=1 Tax=Ramlibacter sp. TaxID=1917967 RepID=UPI002ED2CE8A
MFNLFAALPGKLRASGSTPDTGKRPNASSSIGGTASRKQLLAVVLKETLLRNKVPATWLGIEFFRTMDRSGTRTDGIHVRLLLREDRPELAALMLVLERDFRRRLTIIDHQAIEWLQGVSWQFDVPEEDPLTEPAGATAAPGQEPPAPSLRAGRPRQAPEFTYAHTSPAPL